MSIARRMNTCDCTGCQKERAEARKHLDCPYGSGTDAAVYWNCGYFFHDTFHGSNLCEKHIGHDTSELRYGTEDEHQSQLVDEEIQEQKQEDCERCGEGDEDAECTCGLDE